MSTYLTLQPMRFIVDGGPGDETLPANTTVTGAREAQLCPADARALEIQRKWHKERQIKGRLMTFLWRGKVRFGLLGGDNADIRPVGATR